MQTSMVLKRRDMIARSAVLAAGFIVGCRKRSEPVLRVGTAIWPRYEPFFLADELGYLEDTIQIVEYPGTPEIHRSFQNRAIEAATVTLDEALQLAQVQSDVRVIMAIDYSNGADALLAKPEIKSLSDLKGKRIGVEINALGAFIFSRVLERTGLALDDVTVVPLSTASTEAAFSRGDLDAVIAYEPHVSRLQKAGGVILFDSSQIPGEIMDVLVVRKETFQHHERALINLVSGWFRAAELFKTQSPETAKRAALQYAISENEFLSILQKIELLNHHRNLQLFKVPGGTLSDTVRKLCASMKKYQLLKNMIDPGTLLDARILKRATP